MTFYIEPFIPIHFASINTQGKLWGHTKFWYPSRDWLGWRCSSEDPYTSGLWQVCYSSGQARGTLLLPHLPYPWETLEGVLRKRPFIINLRDLAWSWIPGTSPGTTPGIPSKFMTSFVRTLLSPTLLVPSTHPLLKNMKTDCVPHQGCNFTCQFECWWGTYHFNNTYSPITLTNISFINLVFIFRCSSSPINPVYVRRVDFSDLVFSLSSHRHSYIGLVFSSRFLDS
jgi:hypothetical protein